MRLRYLMLILLLPGARGVAAQSAAGEIAAGDSAHRAMDPRVALAHYRAALKADSTNYGALWRAARESIDLAEFDSNATQRAAYYADGQRFARQAVAAAPDSTDGHFQLARALGRLALTLGIGDRIHYAKEVRQEALAALRADSNDAGAWHVLGMWNAQVMRLSGFSRFMAKQFLGGAVFAKANWTAAVRDMERSVALEPNRLVHRLDLAAVYADVGDTAAARQQNEIVVHGTATDYNDRFYKKQAAQRLARHP